MIYSAEAERPRPVAKCADYDPDYDGTTSIMSQTRSDAQFARYSSAYAHVEIRGFPGAEKNSLASATIVAPFAVTEGQS